jgi:Kef-type K+ transport system membrane component KefB/Trk K+ transport system NAD-binding subunit
MVALLAEVSTIILIAIAIGALMYLLRQPLLIGYILTGIIVSPYLLDIIRVEEIKALGQFGIAFLLFMVGLNLNPRTIKEVGKVAVLSGIGQVLFTAIVGYFIGQLLGLSVLTSLYVAIALTFSSTIIIMKLLSDKGDLETLYGKISIGFLIVQDIIAILLLMIISAAARGTSSPALIAETIFQGVGVFVLLLLIGLYVFPRLLPLIAKSQELLFLFSVGWCLVLATLFYALQFSLEIGALLAGMTLSLSPYRYEISAKMKTLRDFFIALFFIVLGSELLLGDVQASLLIIIVFSLFILIGNPLIMMVIMGMLGYTKRTSFLTGLTVAQISEFSIILVALGVEVGHLERNVLTYVTMIGLITITGSTYLILYAEKLYAFFAPFLTIFEKKGKKVDGISAQKKEMYDILLFGYNRMGYDLLSSIKKLKKRFLIVDYNPETIGNLSKEGYPCKYGDAGDLELLQELQLNKTKMLISTIPDVDINALLIQKAREKNNNAIILVVSHSVEEAMYLYKAGATYVVMPHLLGGKHTAQLIRKHGLNLRPFFQEQRLHLRILHERKKRKNVLKRIYRKVKRRLSYSE